MLRLGFVVALASCHADPHPSVVYAIGSEPDLRPDTEILVGVLGDVDGRLDVRQQLVAQVAQRLPDLVVSASDDLDRALAATKHQQLTAAGVNYGFAHVAASDAVIVVQHATLARAKIVVDPVELGRLDAAAIVRVRRHALTIDVLGADGVAVR